MDPELDRIRERLTALEWNLQRVLQHLQIPWTEPDVANTVPADVVALVQQGNKIAAIKRYRELTGAGLGEAQEVIEQL